MKTLVVGASGATGKLLVEQLLQKGLPVKAIVRNTASIEDLTSTYDQLDVMTGSLLDIPNEELNDYVRDCNAIASCLGHNLTFKGIYGKPRRLVTDAVRKLTQIVTKQARSERVKYVLMNTTGNQNKHINEKVSTGQSIVIGILRGILPPQPDNEQAAEYLWGEIGHDNPHVEWVTVRPDGLIDEDSVSEYELYPSPTRDPIFNAGKTSRINVAAFMAELIADDHLWAKWKGQWPVIYNKGFS